MKMISPSHTFVPTLATPARPTAFSWQVRSTWLPNPCRAPYGRHHDLPIPSYYNFAIFNALDAREISDGEWDEMTDGTTLGAFLRR